MKQLINLLAICGSTRAQSSNLALLKAIEKRYRLQFKTTIFTGIDTIPHFNPDLDREPAPLQVQQFRNLVREAQAVLICSPEYAMGVPGSLKNAIDWTVSSMEFSKKPVALITASSQGQKAHASLLDTLKILECDISDEQQLNVPFIKTKISEQGLMNEELTEKTDMLMSALHANIGAAQVLNDKDQ